MGKAQWILLGYCIGLGGLALITYRTLLAVGSESKSVVLQVNRFGEQYADLVCLVFLWVVCMIGGLSLLSLVREKTGTRTMDLECEGEDDIRMPTVSFTGVPQSFLEGQFGGIGEEGIYRLSMIRSGFSSMNGDGTNGGFSFSVRLICELGDEENG
jgi:hypothetical protein